MDMFTGYVPMIHLPALETLRAEIYYGSPDLTPDQRDQTYDITNSGFQIDEKLTSAERDGYRGSKRVPVSWGKLVLSGAVSVSDIFVKTHVIEMPRVGEGPRAVGLLSKEAIIDDDTHVYLIPTSAFVTYSLFGIDSKDWLAWARVNDSLSMPHQVYEYHLVCKKFGIDPITAAQYVTLAKSLRAGKVLSVESITKWARMAKALTKIGADYNAIDDLGAWLTDGWGPASIALLNRAGITHKVAAEMWNAGLHDACLILRCVTEGLPVEWALDIHTARAAQ